MVNLKHVQLSLCHTYTSCLFMRAGIICSLQRFLPSEENTSESRLWVSKSDSATRASLHCSFYIVLGVRGEDLEVGARLPVRSERQPLEILTRVCGGQVLRIIVSGVEVRLDYPRMRLLLALRHPCDPADNTGHLGCAG